MKKRKKAAIFFLSMTIALLLTAMHGHQSGKKIHDAPVPLSISSENEPFSFSPILSWQKDERAVAYEIEFFRGHPDKLSVWNISTEAIYRTRQVYSNLYNPPLNAFAADLLGKEVLFWRVRSLDIKELPVGPFSQPVPLYTSASLPEMDAPVLTAEYTATMPGHTLLYPVYTWARPADAVSFQIEIYAQDPDQFPQVAAIATLYSDTAEIYDMEPRYGNTPFYWRVHSLDENGNFIGNWSKTSQFLTSPEDNWEVAVLGDSISHGGGHISFSPADFEFSWLSYLDFSAINLSFSGDTSESMLERFDRDVLPFHPHYLLILGGSNSLRAGVPAEDVIRDLAAIKEKCLSHGIKPIFLTLPPINPANISRAFDEPTVDDWSQQFQRVNDYLRTQVYIDTASAFKVTSRGLSPTKFALDGLHPDANGKRRMAKIVNASWEKARLAADNQ